MVTHSSLLAWEIPWTEEPGELVCGFIESDKTQQLKQKQRGTEALLFSLLPHKCNIKALHAHLCLLIRPSKLVQTFKVYQATLFACLISTLIKHIWKYVGLQ